MISSFLGNFINRIHHFGIVAVYEIDFETFDAHIGVVFENRIDIFVQGHPGCPKDDVHITFFGIRNQGFQIHFWVVFHNVGFDAPAFVQNNVFDFVFGSKIDVIFIGFGVDSRLKIDVVDVLIVPPIPSDFTRFYPANILDF